MATAEIQDTKESTTHTISLPVDTVRALFHAVAFAADREVGSRYVLDSVRLEIAPYRVSVCATDGRHMAFRTMETPENRAVGVFLIPRSVADRLAGIGSTASGSVVLEVNAHTTTVRWRQRGGERVVSDETPLGRFPNTDLIVSQVEQDVPVCTMRGTVELVLENLPSVELLDGWSLDPVGRRWTKAPVPFAKPRNKKDPQVELEGSAAPPIDTDRFRAWLRTLSEKQTLEFRWSSDGPCSGWVDGELRYVLMPLRGKP